MSYIKRKCYVGEYEESKKEHAKAVLLERTAKDIFLASADVTKGVISEEYKLLVEAKTVVEEKNALRMHCTKISLAKMPGLNDLLL